MCRPFSVHQTGQILAVSVSDTIRDEYTEHMTSEYIFTSWCLYYASSSSIMDPLQRLASHAPSRPDGAPKADCQMRGQLRADTWRGTITISETAASQREACLSCALWRKGTISSRCTSRESLGGLLIILRMIRPTSLDPCKLALFLQFAAENVSFRSHPEGGRVGPAEWQDRVCPRVMQWKPRPGLRPSISSSERAGLVGICWC